MASVYAKITWQYLLSEWKLCKTRKSWQIRLFATAFLRCICMFCTWRAGLVGWLAVRRARLDGHILAENGTLSTSFNGFDSSRVVYLHSDFVLVCALVLVMMVQCCNYIDSREGKSVNWHFPSVLMSAFFGKGKKTTCTSPPAIRHLLLVRTNDDEYDDEYFC